MCSTLMVKRRKVSESLIEKFIKEEKAASKTYRRLGYKGPSKDEKRHSKYFKRKYKAMEKAEKRKKK